MKKRNIFHKNTKGRERIIALFLSFLLLFLPTATPFSHVYAEEEQTQTTIETPLPTEEQQESSIESDQSTQPSQETTNNPPDTTTIQTDDSTAEATSTIDANTTQGTVGGTITTSDCAVEGSIECSINTVSTANVEETVSSSATTGDNGILQTQTDALIQTGTASAQTTSDNHLNTTVISAEPTTQTDIPPTDPSSINIANHADATLTASADATSGSNQTQDTASSAIVTSDSYASSSMVNVINTTVVGSTLRFLTLSLSSPTDEPINLRDVWNEIEQQTKESGPTMILTSDGMLLRISDTANLDATVLATATSGQNSQTDTDQTATLQTGDSFASANLVNLVNSQIIGSDYLFVVINIFNALDADIILPSLIRFMEERTASTLQTTQSEPSTTLMQDATVGPSHVEAQSETGENTIEDVPDAAIQTGTAYSHGTDTIMANSQLFSDWWYMVLVNNFGSWNGTLDGWNHGSEQTLLPFGSSILSEHLNEQTINLDSTEPSHQSRVAISSQALLKYLVSARAITGENSIRNAAAAALQTGNATALANAFSMVNTTAIGHRFFFPIFNIFGSWNGDLVVAHPDMRVSMNSGSSTVPDGGTTTISVSYTNAGQEEARGTHIAVTLPQGATYEPGSASQPISVAGNTLTAPLGNVAPGASGTLTFSVRFGWNEALSFGQTLKHMLVKSAYAQTKTQEKSVSAAISTTDEESDSSNNWATTTVMISREYSDGEISNQSVSDGQPVLSVSANHNVGEFVYPGDTITFFLSLKNIGAETSNDSSITLSLFDPAGVFLFAVPFTLGTIQQGTGRKVTFGLTVPKAAVGGMYSAGITGQGKAPNGTVIQSSAVSLQFPVRAYIYEQPLSQPVSPPVGQVLAAEDAPQCPPETSQSSWPWMILFLALLLWFVDHTRLRKKENELRETLDAVDTESPPTSSTNKSPEASGG